MWPRDKTPEEVKILTYSDTLDVRTVMYQRGNRKPLFSPDALPVFSGAAHGANLLSQRHTQEVKVESILGL